MTDLRIAQRLPVAPTLVVAEELLNAHPPAVQLAQPLGPAVQVGHQEPGLVTLLGQVGPPADDEVVLDPPVLAVIDAAQHVRHASPGRVPPQYAPIAWASDRHVGLAPHDVVELQLLADRRPLGPAE